MPRSLGDPSFFRARHKNCVRSAKRIRSLVVAMGCVELPADVAGQVAPKLQTN
jgi:hypothetical protein